jgi:hypothetical protein
MPSPTVPLESLAQRIAQHEAELNALRRQYEARQGSLADLTRRKQELQTQLQQVNAEIESVERGTTIPLTKTAPDKPATPAPPASTDRPQTLASLLGELVRDSQGPITVKRLTEEVQARNFPTKSKNFYWVVKSAIDTLLAKGIFQRVTGQPGVILAGSPGKAVAAKAKAGKKGKKKSPSKVATQAKPAAQEKRSLRSILTDLLAKSKKPLAARELAEQILAQGYQSTGKNLINSVYVVIGRMDNIEKVPDQGYRLKKR